MSKVPLFLITVGVLLSFSLPVMASDLEQEYVQVRRIALKDSRVREAFEKAGERLDEKILEIDPALKPIVERDHAKALQPRPAVIEHHVSNTPAPEVQGAEHVITKGETLSSIASHYKVPVASLKSANHITDERKLRIGQKLVIPGSANPEPRQTPAPAAKPADDAGILDWAKKNL